jgi:transposase
MSKELSRPRNAVGRPTKLTPELQERFLANLANALYVETACALTNIHKSVFYDWMQQARSAIERIKKNPDDPSMRPTAKEKALIAFMAEIEKVMEEKQSRWISVIENAAAQGFWTAAAWLCERRYPERYGARRTGEGDLNVNVNVGFGYIQVVGIDDPQPVSQHLIEGEVLDAASTEG